MEKLKFKTRHEAEKVTLSSVYFDKIKIKKETEKAVMLSVVRGLQPKHNPLTGEWIISTFEDEIWIPKSQVLNEAETIRVGTGEFRKRKGESVEKMRRQKTGNTLTSISKWFLDKSDLNDIIKVL